MNTQTIKTKRQRFHRLLISLGEAEHKEAIVAEHIGTGSTMEITEAQLDTLIADALKRLAQKKQPAPAKADSADIQIRKWRNKCLLVLAERGIRATAKDWTAINAELEKKHYQWVLSDAQRERGTVNTKGLFAFSTVDSLRKLFGQLAAIRDAEKAKSKQIKKLAAQN